MSGSNTCEVHGKRYQIELAVYHDRISALHSDIFSPQGVGRRVCEGVCERVCGCVCLCVCEGV